MEMKYAEELEALKSTDTGKKARKLAYVSKGSENIHPWK